MEVVTFSWLDYFLFVSMLASGALVGIYYGFIRKQNTAQEYLLGGKQMNVWTISMSLVSSTLSGFTLLSIPADIYRYGITYGLLITINLSVALTSYYIFLPVFYKLQITSVYEYLYIRFNNKVRVIASFLFSLCMGLFLPVVIYIPALALGQVTNLNIHVITPIVCGICIFYTTLGGLRAVVLTDVIQFGVMLGSLLVVVAAGIWRAVVLTDVIQFGVMLGSLLVVVAAGIWRGGGLGTILKNSYNNGQLDISFDLDFVKRDTFWAVIIGQTAQLMSYFSVGQGSVQKFLSLPSFPTIKSKHNQESRSNITFTFQANIIKSHDQILPLYVMEEVSFIPGLCGLFISGIFSAGLSTLSALMNCLAATIYEDFISPFVSKDTSQEKVGLYLKWIVVIIGISSTALVYVVEQLGGLVQLTLSFSGITSGPTVGLFIVGMLVPQVTSKGALAGVITSASIMTWIILTSQWYKIQGKITYPTLPLSTDGCNGTILNAINQTIANTVNSNTTGMDDVFVVYRISFYWYALLGTIIVIVVSLIVSYFTEQEKPLNEDCIAPIAQFLIKKKNDMPPNYDDAVLEKLNKS
ncbi:Sodium:solute symporter family [Popillia japonica]|uniref:Sodium:solute symporter family n=1 Tax=Popillia japonica TaxID=7064 RepID=A0AAW1JWW9_POPJA